MSRVIFHQNTVIYSMFLSSVLFGLSLNLAAESTTEDHSHHQHLIKKTTDYVKKSESYVIPDVTLIQSDGGSAPLKTLINGEEAIILNFIFTSCAAICPIMSGTFAQVSSKLTKHNKVRIVSISIDPEYDTPAMLKKYAKKFDADSKWVFLTGDLQDIISVQKAFNAYRGKKMNHAPATFIRTKNKSTWLRLDGFASSDDIIREFKIFETQ